MAGRVTHSGTAAVGNGTSDGDLFTLMNESLKEDTDMHAEPSAAHTNGKKSSSSSLAGVKSANAKLVKTSTKKKAATAEAAGKKKASAPKKTSSKKSSERVSDDDDEAPPQPKKSASKKVKAEFVETDIDFDAAHKKKRALESDSESDSEESEAEAEPAPKKKSSSKKSAAPAGKKVKAENGTAAPAVKKTKGGEPGAEKKPTVRKSMIEHDYKSDSKSERAHILPMVALVQNCKHFAKYLRSNLDVFNKIVPRDGDASVLFAKKPITMTNEAAETIRSRVEALVTTIVQLPESVNNDEKIDIAIKILLDQLYSDTAVSTMGDFIYGLVQLVDSDEILKAGILMPNEFAVIMNIAQRKALMRSVIRHLIKITYRVDVEFTDAKRMKATVEKLEKAQANDVPHMFILSQIMRMLTLGQALRDCKHADFGNQILISVVRSLFQMYWWQPDFTLLKVEKKAKKVKMDITGEGAAKDISDEQDEDDNDTPEERNIKKKMRAHIAAEFIGYVKRAAKAVDFDAVLGKTAMVTPTFNKPFSNLKKLIKKVIKTGATKENRAELLGEAMTQKILEKSPNPDVVRKIAPFILFWRAVENSKESKDLVPVAALAFCMHLRRHVLTGKKQPKFPAGKKGEAAADDEEEEEEDEEEDAEDAEDEDEEDEDDEDGEDEDEDDE